MHAFVRMSPRRGVVLIVAVFSLLILGVLAAGFIVGSITEHQMSFNEIEATAGVQCSDGGIAWGYQWLQAQDPPPCANAGAYTLGTYSYPDGASANVSIVYADSNNCSNQYQGWGYKVRSACTRQAGGRSNVTTTELDVVLRKESPACMLVTGCCAINAWYGDFDVTTGRVHFNKTPKITNSDRYPPRGPRFYGKVTVTPDRFQCSGLDQGGGCPPGYGTFYEGYQLNVAEIDCTVDTDPTATCATASGYMLPGNGNGTYITLIADGTMRIYQPGGLIAPWNTAPNGVIRPITTNCVVAINATGNKGDVYLQGTLNGRLTIMAGQEIKVIGDILYASDPRLDPSSDDRLGLMGGWKTGADGDLFFPQKPGVEGDRQIFGFYVGTHCNASIRVEKATSREREGIMMIYGGIMQGQLHATESSDYQHGYGTDWTLDDRGCADPPPCFPDLRRENGTVQWQATRENWQEVL
ncbi:MAG: hypothetical protein MUE60_12180 [Candidatus Eisenbacteria bacterium]|nr:hypothetical protein [Candidatus Eisenbacteria bacterium]